MGEDNREIEIGQKLPADFATLTDRELLAAAGLGLPQPDHYKTFIENIGQSKTKSVA